MENTVAVKLPVFWANQPRVWFQQAEAQFALKNVTVDQTKYYHVVSALDPDTATRLLDLLENPPREQKYTAIKERLLQTFSLSRQQRARRLLDMPPLGDRKPSALMDEMLSLLGNHESCLLFEELFLQRMPNDIRICLAKEDLEEPRQLARRADQLCGKQETKKRSMPS
ncbi:uncharacterized protein LOC144745813 [Ciona intestinalis]